MARLSRHHRSKHRSHHQHRTQPHTGWFSWVRWKARFLYLFRETRAPIAAVCLSLIALNHLGAIDYTLDSLGRGYIATANQKYLKQAEDKAAKSALVLGALHTSLSVLQSSSAGISFIAEVKVQVGQVVSALKDLVDRAWAASLIAAASLVAVELVFKAAHVLDPIVVTLTIITLGVHYATRGLWLWPARICGQVGEILLLITFLVHILLPLMLFGTSLVSHSLTEPMANEAQAVFSDAHGDFGTGPQEKLNDHVKAVITRYKETRDGVPSKTQTFARAVSLHVVSVLFDALLVPASLLGLLVVFARIIIRHTLRIEDLLKAQAPAPVVQQKRRR